MGERKAGRRRRPATIGVVVLVGAVVVVALALVLRAQDPSAHLGERPETEAPTEPAEADDVEPDATPTAEPEPAPPVEEPDTDEPDTDGDGAQPSQAAPTGRFSTDTVSSGGFPSGGGATVYLTDVRVGSHDGFDRVVLEFEGDDAPAHRIGYVDAPITEDGSGEPVAVEGQAFLEIRLTPASGVELVGEDLRTVYDGPQRVAGARTVTEVVRTGDFEATLAWVAGVERTAGFAVDILSDPLRVVVDVAHR